jgi:ACS family tartrate transporter-like MFS transporter
MILYLTYWFPNDARGRAVAQFMTATAIAGAIGSPISGLCSSWTSRRTRRMQWLFLIEGLPSVVLAFVTLAYLPDGPGKASWLSGGRENSD